MIFGHIQDLDTSFTWLPAPLREALEHIRSSDMAAKPAGNYWLREPDLYVQVIDMTTQPIAETRPEVHRRYVDVQYLVRGQECIGVASDTGHNEVSEVLLEKRDLIFYTAMENESTLTMTPGSFAVFLPTDVHRPGVSPTGEPGPVRKVVVKVRLAWLQEWATAQSGQAAAA